MPKYNVLIDNGRERQTYRFVKHSAVDVAISALQSFAKQGLSEFPFHDGHLKVRVEEIEDE